MYLLKHPPIDMKVICIVFCASFAHSFQQDLHKFQTEPPNFFILTSKPIISTYYLHHPHAICTHTVKKKISYLQSRNSFK